MKKKHILLGVWLGCAACLATVFFLFLNTEKSSGLKAADLNLLIITLDTARADRIGAYGYEKARTPHIDALADLGVVFENCFTPVPLTLPSHCSIFTGRYPLAHQVRNNGTYYLDSGERTLAEMMKQQDYSTYAVVSSFVLMSKFGLNQGFLEYDDSLNIQELLHNFYSEIPADVVHAKFHRWLLNNGSRKFFSWVHFYDPHMPYTPPEEFRTPGREGLSDLYDGEIAFVDSAVGRIIEDLRSLNLLEKTLIVLAGDHGEAFGEHQEYGHSVFCYQENLQVPLIFSNPSLLPQARRVQEPVNLIDILPTLLDLYQTEIPPAVQGRSLIRWLQGQEDRRERPFYIESMFGREEMGWAPLTGIVEGPFKYISLPEPELFHLKDDPDENNNLIAREGRIAREMHQKLLQLIQRFSSSGEESRRELTPDDKRRLESLGYISSFSNRSNAFLDPKKGIELHSAFNLVNLRIESGDLAAAEVELQAIAARNPPGSMPQYYELLAKIYERKPDLQRLLDIWQQAVAAFPLNNPFKLSLALKLFQMGQVSQAEEVARSILQTDVKFARAHILLADIAEKQGRDSDAQQHFAWALDLEPHNIQLQLSHARSLMRSGDHSRALQACRRILENQSIAGDPAQADILSRVGILYTEMNQETQALQVLQDAARMDPGNAETWNYLGVVHFRQKKLAEATEAYQRAISLDPRFALALNNLGVLYLRTSLETKNSRMLDQAIEAFSRAIQADLHLASAYNGRGSAYKFSNRVTLALLDWQEALKNKPDFIEVYFNLGVTYLQIGNKQEARRVLDVCRQKYYDRLSPQDKGRLDRLIAQSGL